MEPKHKELLAQCRQSLAHSMTEVDKVIELLEAAGTLSPRDLLELQEAAGGGTGVASKADLLIQLLLAKDRDHFQDLRVALEKTQPHLLSILYLNGVAGAPPGETAGERVGEEHTAVLHQDQGVEGVRHTSRQEMPTVALMRRRSHAASMRTCTPSSVATPPPLPRAVGGTGSSRLKLDEEVELEDDLEQTAGSSGDVASHDLFSTLEGSSQSQRSDSLAASRRGELRCLLEDPHLHTGRMPLSDKAANQ
ncbi:Disks large like protein 5 [Chelonia mydas]|uniref:Disks large like protein 5 n=1 Tax=Chelonia mydas TaxID=8469 RepID=M7AVN5_CHEMY|nr:Disks large like protein 5 [Chelonia mydas]